MASILNFSNRKDTMMITATSIFLILYGVLVYWRPSAVFDAQGNMRPFGIGRPNTTIVPLWMCVMMLAVLSYAWAKRLA